MRALSLPASSTLRRRWRPVASGFLLAVGAAAGGALLTHLSCVSDSARHWLFGHTVGPLLIGVIAGALLAWWFGCMRARTSRREALAR